MAQGKDAGILELVGALWKEISNHWFNPDKLVDLVDSAKKFRMHAAQMIGLPTKEEVDRVEELLARSQERVQRLEGSVAKLESVIEKMRAQKAKPAAKKTSKRIVRETVKKPKSSKVGKKPPSSLLEIDLGRGKRAGR